ncbi:hypothetical protein Patl1_02539 [Pistacia atlantica]|uniref:Uncharacterized protein n=1 Tax=Pistacia atlantica TaxID=434234 RepID=A0ACC1C549_9ROSI|nr:hypothetical protein Patl1_02539 [Pistacia atlantica]
MVVQSLESGQAERRMSARIQEKQREEKLRLVKRRVELLGDTEGGSDGKKKQNNISSRKRRKEEDSENAEEGDKVPVQTTKCESESMNGNAVNLADKGDHVINLAEKSDHAKVKETLRLFNKHYLHFVQLEEARCRKEEVDKKASKKSKSKKGNVPEENTKHKAKRPDLKAISKMMEENEILYPEKRIGDIPGINVGHQFYSRSEMVAVGFHSHWLNGIDYMGMSYGRVKLSSYRMGEYLNKVKFTIDVSVHFFPFECYSTLKSLCYMSVFSYDIIFSSHFQVYKQYQFPLAVAIVLSGMYEDDLDNAEDVIYTGQGGHDLTGNKRQIQDQVLERGNLALKNCVEQNVPVRVIRGLKSSTSYTGKVYTYDGLYKVVQYWAEKGISGFTVFKYRLRRLEGQPILTTNQVHFTHGRVPQSMSEIRGLVCEDITGGQENFPIPATNLVDDPPVAPTGKANY